MSPIHSHKNPEMLIFLSEPHNTSNMRKKITLSLCAFILLAGAAWKAYDAFIPSLYRATIMQVPYEYMFSQSGPEVTLFQQSFTSFEGGFKGLFLYSGMKTAMEESMEDIEYSEDFYDLSVLSDYAGLPAFTDGKTELNDYMSDDFLHYNPDFVYWAFENLVPNPEETLDGYSYQSLYDIVGSRFIRLLAETYILLGYRDEDIGYYRDGIEEGDFDAWLFTEDREFIFRDLNARYSPEGADSPLTANMAYTWWIRRNIDGSSYAFWDGISDILQTYDPEFYENLWED